MSTTDATHAVPETAVTATFTVTAGELVRALTILDAAIPRRPLVPVLAYLKVSASPEGISVSGFDYETAVTVQLTGEASAATEVLLHHRQLLDTVKALRRGMPAKAAAQLPVTVSTTVTGSGAAARTEAVLRGGGWVMPLDADSPVADYPLLPPLADQLAQVDKDAFTAMFSRCAQFAHRDDSRPALTGVQVTFAEDSLILRATDRYRAARGIVAAETAKVRGAIVVAARDVAKLLKRLPGTDLRVGLTAGDRLSVVSGAVKVTTREVGAGEFVELDRLMPQSDLTVTVPTAQLLANTEKAAALTAASDSAGDAVIRYRVTADGIAVEPVTEREPVEAPMIAADDQQGDPHVTVGLVAKRAVEAVRSIHGEHVTLTVLPDGGKRVMFTDPAELGAYAHILATTRNYAGS